MAILTETVLIQRSTIRPADVDRRSEVGLRVYRINAVGTDGTAIVLGVADTASQALKHLQDAFADYPRVWVTNEYNLDVTWAELMRKADEERERVPDRGSLPKECSSPEKAA